jgi:AraC-like DNA-binding protein
MALRCAERLDASRVPAYGARMAGAASGDGFLVPRTQLATPVRHAAQFVGAAPADHAHSFPAGPALQLIRVVERLGFSAEQLLRGLGFSEELLEVPGARLSADTVRALVERARELTGEPGLGFYLGLEKRVTNYGYLGFAAMSAASVRQALELTVRFVPAQTGAFSVRLQVEGGLAALAIDLHTDFGSVEDVFLFNVVVTLWQLGRALTGKDLGGLTELTIPEPRYYRRFVELLPNVRFEQPANRLVFDAALLDLPLVSADRAALRLAREHCEVELDASIADSGLLPRVRAILARASEAAASVAEVAAAMGMSPRTLKRRLAAHGVSFSALLADARRDSALRLLSASALSVDAIAQRLGYSTAPNFIRAFRRWTGRTPSAYRRLSREQRPLGGDAAAR